MRLEPRSGFLYSEPGTTSVAAPSRLVAGSPGWRSFSSRGAKLNRCRRTLRMREWGNRPSAPSCRGHLFGAASRRFPTAHTSKVTGSAAPLHVPGESHVGWRPVIGALAAEYDVIAIDLHGFGRSPALSRTMSPPRLTSLPTPTRETAQPADTLQCRPPSVTSRPPLPHTGPDRQPRLPEPERLGDHRRLAAREW